MDPQPTKVPDRAVVCLMASYAMGAWAWRSWEFAVALLLIDLWPTSLLMVSIYGLVDNGVRVTLGPTVGDFVSRRQLQPAARTMFAAQNSCILVSAVCAVILLGEQFNSSDQMYWVLLVILVLLGALSSAGSAGVRISVEVEAVKALAGDNSQRLSELNAGFRAIDLACLLLAPLVVGVLMTFVGTTAGAMVIGVYCAGAWIPEVALLAVAVRGAPELQHYRHRESNTQPQQPAKSAESAEEGILEPLLTETPPEGVAAENEVQPQLAEPSSPCGEDGHGGEHEDLDSGKQATSIPAASHSQDIRAGHSSQKETPASRVSWAVRAHRHMQDYAASWHTYGRQAVFLPCLALAMLYCTVLSLGFLMTGYLKWSGLTSAEVSAYRGLGALTGLTATFVFPWLKQRLGLVSVGVAGIIIQMGCLMGGVLPIAIGGLWQPGGPGHLQPSTDLVRILVAGVATSRFGLWTFDLAVTQLIQERVPGPDLGRVSGVQSSLSAAFETFSFCAGIWLHDPELFYWLMMWSLCFVGVSVCLFAVFAVRQRHHACAALSTMES